MKVLLLDIKDAMQSAKASKLRRWCEDNGIKPLLLVAAQDNESVCGYPGCDRIPCLMADESVKTDFIEPVSLGGICLYPSSKRVEADGIPVKLNNKEFKLLLYLMRHVEQIVSKEQLYKHIWGESGGGDYNTVIVHINRIRKKIEKDPANPRHVITVYGSGYRFQP